LQGRKPDLRAKQNYNKRKLPRYAGYIIAATLFGWGVGGVLGGIIADYIGRKRTMMLAILASSLTTGLSAVARTQNRAESGRPRCPPLPADYFSRGDAKRRTLHRRGEGRLAATAGLMWLWTDFVRPLRFGAGGATAAP
jgi:MFS family permease